MINPIRENEYTQDYRRQITWINLECLFGNFTPSIPFLDVFILMYIHQIVPPDVDDEMKKGESSIREEGGAEKTTQQIIKLYYIMGRLKHTHFGSVAKPPIFLLQNNGKK